jgi:glutamine amidotransferase
MYNTSTHILPRWIAYISHSEPCLLEDVLVTPKHSLVKQVSDHYLPKLLPHEHDADSENDVKARNVVMNFDGLGVVWYTSSNADFERGKTRESSDGAQKDVSIPSSKLRVKYSHLPGPPTSNV